MLFDTTTTMSKRTSTTTTSRPRTSTDTSPVSGNETHTSRVTEVPSLTIYRHSTSIISFARRKDNHPVSNRTPGVTYTSFLDSHAPLIPSLCTQPVNRFTCTIFSNTTSKGRFIVTSFYVYYVWFFEVTRTKLFQGPLISVTVIRIKGTWSRLSYVFSVDFPVIRIQSQSLQYLS